MDDYSYRQQIQMTSYLSSTSVPTTPPVLSDSRDAWLPNLSKKKKASRSDTRLDLMNDQLSPRHHRTQSHNPRERVPQPHHEDNEWLLRAGLALATSTREEKGQSWLVKRESSTSLVSDLHPEPERRPHLSRSQTARRYRSGYSTPAAALSRRNSHSNLFNNGALYMTSGYPRSGARSGTRTPAYSQAEIPPEYTRGDMNDELRFSGMHNPSRIEDAFGQDGIASHRHSRRSSYFDPSFPPSDMDYSSADSDEESEFGEVDMQRLTRQQGFGLGPWVDRLVQWALFDVEEEPNATAGTPWVDDHETLVKTTTQLKEFTIPQIEEESESGEETDDRSTGTAEDATSTESVEGPSGKGGWADVKWLLSAARNAI